MRIWSINPRLLDKAGIGALWREGLLALNVLKGKTKGYKNHPQLVRFKQCENPVQAITDYLHFVCDNADLRGYHYDRTKLGTRGNNPEYIEVSIGQIIHELKHLKSKIISRNFKALGELSIDIDFNLSDRITSFSHEMVTCNYYNDNIENWEKV